MPEKGDDYYDCLFFYVGNVHFGSHFGKLSVRLSVRVGNVHFDSAQCTNRERTLSGVEVEVVAEVKVGKLHLMCVNNQHF